MGSAFVLLALHQWEVAHVELIEIAKAKLGWVAKTREYINTSAAVKKIRAFFNDVKEKFRKKTPMLPSGGEHGLTDTENCQVTDEKKEIIEPYSKRVWQIIAGVSFVLFTGTAFTLNYYVFSGERSANEWFNFLKLFYVLVIVVASALIDFKKRIIPNKLVATGIVLRAVIYIGELLCNRALFKDILINDLIGLALGFGFLFIAGLLSGGGVGFGDAKLFAVIGISTGYICTFATLFFSLAASAVISIILLVKYHDKKRTFAFAPFILIGYLIVLFMGSF